MKPIGENVLVVPCAAESVTEGGMITSEAHRTLSSKVVIVATGPGTKKQPMRFKEGQIAFRVKDTGEKIEHEGKTYFLLPQSYLLAVIKNN